MSKEEHCAFCKLGVVNWLYPKFHLLWSRL